MQRDYILRLIEQAAAILRHLLQRVRERSVDAATLRQDLQRASHLGGLDLDLLRLCDAQTLLQIVAPAGEIDPSRVWLAAEVLYLDGLALDPEGQTDDAIDRFGKAAALYALVQPGWVLPTGFPEATARLQDVESRLAGLAGDSEAPSSD
jgi:hypothetical protein